MNGGPGTRVKRHGERSEAKRQGAALAVDEKDGVTRHPARFAQHACHHPRRKVVQALCAKHPIDARPGQTRQIRGIETLKADIQSRLPGLIAGQIDAIAMPDTVVTSMKATRPDADVEIKFTFFEQPNAMAVKKDAFELRQWLNNAIYYMKVMGDLDAVAQKWTGQSVPPLPVF